jgi:preprotein translocase subunit SecA
MWPFKEKPAALHLDDRVWMSKQKKYDHLITDAKFYLEEGKIVILSYFFLDTGTYLAERLKREDISYSVPDVVRPEFDDKINLVQVESDTLLSKYFLDKLTLGNREVIILFAEIHPLFKVKKALVESISPLGTHLSYCFYISMDEPLLTHFAGDRMKELITKLQIGEDEMISHHMVSVSIENVQKKIESQVKFELRAYSMEEWFSVNLKS